MDVQDEVIESISKATNGVYDDLSKNYRRMFEVEKNIDNALGAVGTGAISGVRGKEIKNTLLNSLKNMNQNDDMFQVADGFLGKINSQINLLDDIGLFNPAQKIRTGLIDLSENLLKESDYKKIDKVLKEINSNVAVGEKVNVGDLKKLLKVKDVINKGDIKNILTQSKNVKQQGKTIKTLARNVVDRKEGISNIQEFHSFNDRYMPMIVASTMASMIPVLGVPIRTMAGLYTVYKLRNLGAYNAIKAIEKISQNAMLKNMSQQQKIAFQQFTASQING
jgi:hypothetical protein